MIIHLLKLSHIYGQCYPFAPYDITNYHHVQYDATKCACCMYYIHIMISQLGIISGSRKLSMNHLQLLKVKKDPTDRFTTYNYLFT